MPRHDACHAGYEWLIAAMVASKRQPGKMVQALAMMKPKEEAVVEEEASAEGVEVEEEAWSEATLVGFFFHCFSLYARAHDTNLLST